MSAARPRVAVVFNEPILPAGHPDATSEADVVDVAHSIADALVGAEFVPVLVPASPPLPLFLERLIGSTPDLVFNLIEGFGGVSAGETYVTSLYELLKLPYTGSPVEAIALCHSKARTKAILRGFGLPTADAWVVRPGESVPHFEWQRPVVIKPDAEDGSLGIDQLSVVTEPSQISERVDALRARFGGSVLIEAYLSGPEFNVGLIALPDPKALPAAQVQFSARPGTWPILTYAAKWDAGSEEDLATPIICPAPIEAKLAARLGELAVAAFRATDCRDYARVDFRLDTKGKPMILEVNPNPDIGPAAGWARAARAAGLEHSLLVSQIARQALRRGAFRR